MSEQKYIRVDEINLHYSGLETIAPNDYVGIVRHFEREIRHLPAYTPAEILAGMWVPVTERLPEPLVEVLALYGDGSIDIDWLDNDGDFFYSDLYDGVTHWMPLPQPPKEVPST